ncbi:biopolymer transporter Tol [Frondihabitans peucedani]|uniref:Biopolymer transporter Tol n=1 Tax=Frondihabitans peucedani TaxID=598626 RepID=A0ABP8E190_9MICO
MAHDASAGDPDGDGPDGDSTDAERWLVVNGRRWRRTDPSLPDDLVEALKSHLGRGRSGVRSAKRAGDDDAVAAARKRNGLAKHGLGERGPAWWDEPEEARLARALGALSELEALDGEPPAT